MYALGELSADGLIESRVGQGTVIINNTWSLLAATPPPDWNQYVKSGSYQPNIQMIQQINRAETDSNMIRLGTGELARSPPDRPNAGDVERQDVQPFHLGLLGTEREPIFKRNHQ